MLVFVEGQKTEDGYLTDWARRLRDRVLITVDPYSGEDPLNLVRRAVEARQATQRESQRGRGKPYDAVWCVFDVDEHVRLPEALELASQQKIPVALSNPCVELWFLLHFEEQWRFLDRREAQRRAESHLGCGKALTTGALSLLFENHTIAVDRARALDRKHELDGSPPRSNPSSGIHVLIAAMLEA